MDPKDIKKRFDALKSQRTTVEATWDVITRFVAPFKGSFFRGAVSETGIQWQERDVYDATAVQAHIQLASSLHGAATNPAIRWFELAWRDEKLIANHAAKLWLQNASKRCFSELQDSNFNLEANTAYRGLTSVGTAFLIQEPKADFTQNWQGMQFSNVPIKQGYFETDDKMQVRCFYRALEWKASQLAAKCDEWGIDMPSSTKKLYDAGSDQPITVVFAVYPNKNAQTGKVVPENKRPFQYTYMLYDDCTVLKTGGYYEMPVTAPRWEVTDESIWGHSPAHYALADILTLNQLVELDLKSREKIIDPAILAEENALISDLDFGPGRVNIVRSRDAIGAFESAARFDAVESSITRLQQAIQRYFYIDQLELKESPAMTATEVQVRYELMQRLLASTMSRIKEDMLNPIVQRTFNMLWRAGEFDEPPEGVNAADYDIHYIGPLSRSMRFDQSASIERWITQLGMIANTGGEDAQDVLLVPDYDKIARVSAENLDLPVDLLRPKNEVEADMKGRRSARTEAAQGAVNRDNAAAARDLAGAQELRTGEQSIV